MPGAPRWARMPSSLTDWITSLSSTSWMPWQHPFLRPKPKPPEPSRAQQPMTNRIAITHALVLPMDDAHSMIVDGAVVIDGDRIVEVGPSEQVMARLSAPVQRVVDATGQAVMPGFVDLHYHTALAKGWNDNLPLKEW